MRIGAMDLQGSENTALPADWLPGLAKVIAGGALPQRDPRIRQLYEVLRRRGLWGRSPRMRRVLRFAWKNGLAPRQRPRLGQWFHRRLTRWGLLPGQPVTRVASIPGVARRPLRRVGLRPVNVRRVRPVQVAVAPRPMSRASR